jgi:hypothetical protein
VAEAPQASFFIIKHAYFDFVSFKDKLIRESIVIFGVLLIKCLVGLLDFPGQAHVLITAVLDAVLLCLGQVSSTEVVHAVAEARLGHIVDHVVERFGF